MKQAGGRKRKPPTCSLCNGQLDPPGHNIKSCPKKIGDEQAAWKAAKKTAERAAARGERDEYERLDRVAELAVKHALDKDPAVLEVLKGDNAMTNLLGMFRGFLESVGASLEEQEQSEQTKRRLSFEGASGDTTPAHGSTSPSPSLPPRSPKPPVSESPSKELFEKVLAGDPSRDLLRGIFRQLLHLCRGIGKGVGGHSSVNVEAVRRHFGAELGNSVESILGVLRLMHYDSLEDQPLSTIRALFAGKDSSLLSSSLPGNIEVLHCEPLKADTLDFLLREVVLPSIEKALSLSFIPRRGEKELYYPFLNLLEPLLACDKERKLQVATANVENTVQAVEEQWMRRAGKQRMGAAGENKLEEAAADEELEEAAADEELEEAANEEEVEEDDSEANSVPMQKGEKGRGDEAGIREEYRRLKIWFEGWLGGSMSAGPAEFVFTKLPILTLLGVLEAKLEDADFLEALPQCVAEMCAIIEWLAKQSKTNEEKELSTFGIISNFKLWLFVKLIRFGKDVNGEWKTKILTAGPYQLYDIATKQLHPDSRPLLSHLCNLLIPSMQTEERKVWEDVSHMFDKYHRQVANEVVDKMDKIDPEKQELREQLKQAEKERDMSRQENEELKRREQELIAKLKAAGLPS